MADAGQRVIVVAGATGLQGGAVTRHLLEQGWRVRGLTRNAASTRARALTILRPMAFMELMTDRRFFPAVAAWHVMPALMEASRPVGWLCTDDLGAIAARVFAAPHQFVGQDLPLANDVQSLEQCRSIFRAMMGQNPPRFLMPTWLFARFGFAGRDLTAMWHWLRTATIDPDTAPTRAIHPEALTVRGWPSRRKAGASPYG